MEREVQALATRLRRAAITATALAAFFAGVATAGAGEADVLVATATMSADGSWRIEVTVSHADAGWEHYADAWEVLAPDGRLLDTRTLAHPHDMEQPFTRALSGVKIPADVSVVEIRAHDSVHGYGGAGLTLNLAR